MCMPDPRDVGGAADRMKAMHAFAQETARGGPLGSPAVHFTEPGEYLVVVRRPVWARGALVIQTAIRCQDREAPRNWPAALVGAVVAGAVAALAWGWIAWQVWTGHLPW